MALAKTFDEKFTEELATTIKSGNIAAWGTGIGTGTAASLPYFVQGKKR